MGKKLALVLAAAAMVCLLAGSGFAGQKTYVNGIDFGFPPFGFVNPAGQPDGFDVEAVNWIAKKMGFKVKHQPMEWEGIIPALTSKKIDFIASGMTATAERAKIVNFSDPYFKVTQVLLVAKDNDKSLEDVLKSGVVIGVQRGTITGKLCDKMSKQPGYDFTVRKYDSTDLALQDLPLGRIQGSGMDNTIAFEMMKGNDNFRIAGTFDAPPENYGYAVRKEDKDLLNTLNKGLALLMADPYWKELKSKWGLP